jgi:hypothetical protein
VLPVVMHTPSVTDLDQDPLTVIDPGPARTLDRHGHRCVQPPAGKNDLVKPEQKSDELN